MTKVKLWHPEVEEFAQIILGLPEDFEGDIDDEIEKKFNCSFDSFKEIIESVIQYTPTHKSELTGSLHRGFVNGMYFILKYQVEAKK